MEGSGAKDETDGEQDGVELDNPSSIKAKKRKKKNRKKKTDVSILEPNNTVNSTNYEFSNINSYPTFQEWLNSLNWDEMVS